MSKFGKWFEAQHGKRERSMAHLPDQRLRDMIDDGRAAEVELRNRTLWDEKQKSAMNAWTASRTAQSERAKP